MSAPFPFSNNDIVARIILKIKWYMEAYDGATEKAEIRSPLLVYLVVKLRWVVLKEIFYLVKGELGELCYLFHVAHSIVPQFNSKIYG